MIRAAARRPTVGLLSRLAHDQVDLGAGLRDDFLDAPGVDSAVAHELREREAGDLPANRIEARDDDGLRGVVDDQVDAGGLLEGPDVAALAADDPALHLVVREVDDGHRVLRGVVRGDALDRGDDDVAGLLVGLVAGLALDRPGELDRVVLGLLADSLEEERLGVVGRHAADPLERRDLLLVGLRDGLPGGLELALAVEELAVALLEHVRPLVELLVALEEPALERRELVALRPGLVLRLALEAQLLVLRLEDQLLLAGARLGLDPAPLGLGRLHRLRGPQAAHEHANGDAANGGQHVPPGGAGVPSSVLPSGRLRAGRAMLWSAVRRGRGRRSDGPSVGRDRRSRVPRRQGDASLIWRSHGGPP
jgi:hypothetical protein